MELVPIKQHRPPLLQERAESAPARDLRASGFKTGGRRRPGGGPRGEQHAGRTTPSSAAASPVRQSGRVRSGPAPA
jgi:hypothetical protein